jgi:chromate transporter
MMTFTLASWWDVFLHFMAVSLMAVGGAVTVIPEMHRHLVHNNAWMSDEQFAASIAIAQSAPGPNILVIAMMGWHIGINSVTGLGAQYAWGIFGMVLAMIGVMLPSSVLTFSTAHWVQANQFSAKVIAFKQGLAPLVIGAILATSWLISATNASWQEDWALWLCTVISVLLVWKTKVHILWLLLVGAILGALGLI